MPKSKISRKPSASIPDATGLDSNTYRIERNPMATGGGISVYGRSTAPESYIDEGGKLQTRPAQDMLLQTSGHRSAFPSATDVALGRTQSLASPVIGNPLNASKVPLPREAQTVEQYDQYALEAQAGRTNSGNFTTPQARYPQTRSQFARNRAAGMAITRAAGEERKLLNRGYEAEEAARHAAVFRNPRPAEQGLAEEQMAYEFGTSVAANRFQPLYSRY